MIFYALIASDSDFAIDLYPTRERPEQALSNVLHDEPSFADILAVAEIDFGGTTPFEPSPQ